MNLLEDAHLERRGRLLSATALHRAADHALEVVLLAALGAGFEVRADLGDIRRRQRAVEVLVEALKPRFIAVAESLTVAHCSFSCLLEPAPAKPRSAA